MIYTGEFRSPAYLLAGVLHRARMAHQSIQKEKIQTVCFELIVYISTRTVSIL